MPDFQHYPKMMYKGLYNPEAGLGPLAKVIVASAKEEKAKATDGYVAADDLESLMADPPKKEKPKVAEKDPGQE